MNEYVIASCSGNKEKVFFVNSENELMFGTAGEEAEVILSEVSSDFDVFLKVMVLFLL